MLAELRALMDTLQACDTWGCVNSFADWLSAFGTILVSSLALWFSMKERILRLKCSFDIGLVPGSERLILNQQVFILSFTNIGLRPVTVTNFRLRYGR